MFLKNRSIISKNERSKVTDYAAITNSADPDEMQQFVALHLGLHYLSKYSFRSQWLSIHVSVYIVAQDAGQAEKLFLVRPN